MRSAKVPSKVDLPRPGSAVTTAADLLSTASDKRESASSKLLCLSRPAGGTGRAKGMRVRPKWRRNWSTGMVTPGVP
jgi:hypothetical protein